MNNERILALMAVVATGIAIILGLNLILVASDPRVPPDTWDCTEIALVNGKPECTVYTRKKGD